MNKEKVILFGSGQIGRKALSYFGREKVYCFVSNHVKTTGRTVESIPVVPFETLKEIYPDYPIVVSMDLEKSLIVAAQLEKAGITKYTQFMQILSSDRDWLAAASEEAETLGKMVKYGGYGKSESSSEVYNEYYKNFGSRDGYHKHYSQSIYYFSWKTALSYVEKLDPSNSILEIGCGVGQFANMLFDRGFTNYIGFDFSKEAVNRAKWTNAALADRFIAADAFETDLLEKQYDLVICFEMLEHINKDLELIERVRSGTRLLLSVPNFDDPYHVRFFRSEAEIQIRYGQIIKIENIKVSMLSDYYWLYYIWGEKL